MSHCRYLGENYTSETFLPSRLMISCMNYYIVSQIKYKALQTPITGPMETSRSLVSVQDLFGLLQIAKDWIFNQMVMSDSLHTAN